MSRSGQKRKSRSQRSLSKGFMPWLRSALGARPTPYRDGQNDIKNSSTGALIYLPPEAKDVPALMASLVAWAAEAEGPVCPLPS